MRTFRDPNLSDRELMLLILFELARTRSDIKFLKKCATLDEANKSVGSDCQLELFHTQAFDEMEADMLLFVKRKQNIEGN